ncbi:MAG: hypothetical protein IJ678_04970 [Kiritimatiellae bacterium]|nr:hypothetical protein [Kiritimatiellia bacterium]
MSQKNYRKVSSCAEFFSHAMAVSDAVIFMVFAAEIAFLAVFAAGSCFCDLAIALGFSKICILVLSFLPFAALLFSILFFRACCKRKCLPDILHIQGVFSVLCTGLRFGTFLFLSLLFNPVLWGVIFVLATEADLFDGSWPETESFIVIGFAFSFFLYVSCVHACISRREIFVPAGVVSLIGKSVRKIDGKLRNAEIVIKVAITTALCCCESSMIGNTAVCAKVLSGKALLMRKECELDVIVCGRHEKASCYVLDTDSVQPHFRGLHALQFDSSANKTAVVPPGLGGWVFWPGETKLGVTTCAFRHVSRLLPNRLVVSETGLNCTYDVLDDMKGLPDSSVEIRHDGTAVVYRCRFERKGRPVDLEFSLPVPPANPPQSRTGTILTRP